MSRRLTIIALTVVVDVGLVLVGWGSSALAQVPGGGEDAQAAKAAEEWVKNNPPGRTTAQALPVVKDNLCLRVSPKEREAVGLPAPTWVAADGKVQPAVRAALGQQKKLIESRDPMVEFQGDRPGGFQGTAYVDVYVRHEAKGKPTSKESQAVVREVQAQILRKLTAAEFSLIFAFKNTAGLTGYVDDVGLAKLTSDPDVVAVGLDDQARPEDPPITLHEAPPAPRRGERPPPTKKIGKVEADVYEALEKSADGYAYVIVGVARVLLGSGPFWDEYEAKKSAIRALQDHVLSALSADEFRARGRGASLSGYANGAGLAKLAGHPDVDGVGLNMAVRFFDNARKSSR